MDHLKRMLTNAVDELHLERNKLSETKTNSDVREKELLFLIKTLEDQLEFEKQRNVGGDVTVADVAIKTEFQKR